MDKAAKNWTGMTEDVYSNYIKEPDTVDIKKCLGGIGGISSNFGFSLPSIDNLIDQACTFAVSKVKGEISQVSNQMASKYSFESYGVGANASSGGYGSSSSGVPQFNVNDTSNQTVRAIWDAIQ